MRWFASLPLLVGVLASSATSVVAATIHVPADQPTIQNAVTVAGVGDTILVSPGTFGANIQIQKSLSVLAETDAQETFIIGNFVVGSGCALVVDGFAFVGGSGTVLNTDQNSSLTVRRCIFDGFSAQECVRGGEGVVVRISFCLFKMDFVQNPVVTVAPGCEFVNNTIVGGGSAGLAIYGANSIIKNNIVSNLPAYGIHNAHTTSDVSYNDFWQNNPNYSSTTPGPGSISLDPQFADADANLIDSSPCIDAGDPSPSYNDSDGSRNDMGARPLLCNSTLDSSDCDLDGFVKINDNCPFLSNPSQTDVDTDGIGDACDNCFAVWNENQADLDVDSWGDACDNCPTSANIGQEDFDGDQRGDVCDNCPGDFNPSQTDSDSDGIGDICDACLFDPDNDADGDGVCGNSDNCPGVANGNQADADLDGVGDVCDNCPSKFNPAQEETDGDGIADSCDNCPTVFNASQTDVDNDGIGNACDACLTDPLNDSDADGVCHSVDNCPTVYNPGQADTNGNNIGDACDCSCLCHGDPQCDAVIADVLDVVSTINVAFRGSAAIIDPSATCPWQSTDVDCSGATDVLDVVKTVNVAFRGANAVTDYCDPCL